VGVPESDVMLGRLLVEQRLVRAEHVDECLAAIARSGEGAPQLGELLVRRGYLTPAAYASTISGSRPSGAAPELPPEVAKSGPSERFGRYVRVDRLGAGGMGEVWRAYDTDLHRWVALKFLKADDPDDLARFQREAQVAARLSHANIAAVYEVGEAQGRHFIAMQLVRGRTLKAYARRPAREVVELVRDAARAVAAANAQGVVHRDLKPDNIMVEESPRRVYVMDFGLARHVQGAAHSASGLLIGTPSYMSPEQARGQRADERADVYSLGATLYDLLAGHVPFDGTSVIDILMRVVHEDPKPLRVPSSRLDRDIETIVMKCLEKERDRRYGGAAELADDLDRWLGGEPISARPASLAYRWRKRLAKRKALVAVSAVAILVAGVLLGLAVAARRGEATAHRTALEHLARTSQTALDAALAMRRLGNIDGMRRFAEETEEACAAAMRDMPEAAPPHYHRGRMLRAQQRFEDALAAQVEALRRDPRHAGARYERGLMLVIAYESRIERLRRAWRVRRAEQQAGLPGGEPADEPARDALEDARAKEFKAAAIADLERTTEPVAEALTTWLRGGDAAPGFERAARETPDREEGWEWRARLARDGKRYDEAVDWYTRGHERDRGYTRHLAARAEALLARATERTARGEDARDDVRLAIADMDAGVALAPDRDLSWYGRGDAKGQMAFVLIALGEDASEAARGAIEDYGEALRREPGRATTWWSRAKARLVWAFDRVQRGGDPLDLYRDAAADLGRALDIDPQDGESWYLRGMVRQTEAMYRARRGDDPRELWEGALEDAGRALKLDAGREDWWAARAYSRAMRAYTASVRGREPGGLYDAAEADFAQALRLRDTREETWRHRGLARLNRAMWVGGCGGDAERVYADAVTDLDRALALRPTSAESLAARGSLRLHSAIGRVDRGEDVRPVLEEALKDFDEALRLRPGRVDALSGRGQAHATRAIASIARGEDPAAHCERALADLDAALAVDPGQESVWRMRGWVRQTWSVWMLKTGRSPEELAKQAIADQTRALDLNPAFEEAFVARGTAHGNIAAYLVQRRQDAAEACARAIVDFDAAIAINPRRDETWLRRGQVRQMLAIYEVGFGRDPAKAAALAAADYDAAIERNARRVEAWMERGTLRGLQVLYWTQVGQPRRSPADPEVRASYEKAVADLGEALRLNPGSSDALSRRATYHYIVGSWREALADWEQAVKLAPALEAQFRGAMEDCRRRLK